MDTLRGGGGGYIMDGCEQGGGGGCQEYGCNINNDFISETTDVERVSVEKCVERILKQAEQIGKNTFSDGGRESKKRMEMKWYRKRQ